MLVGAGLVCGCAPGVGRSPNAGESPQALAPPRVTHGDLDAWHVLGDVPDRAQRLGAGAPSLVGSGLAAACDWGGGVRGGPVVGCSLSFGRAEAVVADDD